MSLSKPHGNRYDYLEVFSVERQGSKPNLNSVLTPKNREEREWRPKKQNANEKEENLETPEGNEGNVED